MPSFRFPKNCNIREKWIDILNIFAEDVDERSTVCSKHFHVDFYSKSALQCPRLLPGSLPMQHVALPETNKEENETNTSKRQATEVLQRTPKKARYMGDMVPELHFSTPRKARKSLNFIQLKFKKKNRQIKTLKQRNRRLLKKVADLEQLLKHLQHKNLISEEAAIMLQVGY